jgi:hypothetical protein
VFLQTPHHPIKEGPSEKQLIGALPTGIKKVAVELSKVTRG